MKIKSFGICLMFVIILFCFVPSSCKGQKIPLSTQLEIEFGEVPTPFHPLDTGVKHRIKVKNIGNDDLVIALEFSEVKAGLEPWIFPQTHILCLSPGEEEWTMAMIFADPNRVSPTELEPGEHNYLVNYTFVNFFDKNDYVTFMQEFTFIVLDEQNMTGDFKIEGKVVDKEGKGIRNASVRLFAGLWSNEIKTKSDGSFSFSVPSHHNWWILASKEGYKSAYKFNLSEGNHTLTLLPLTKIPEYKILKQIRTDIGFWKAATTSDTSHILLTQGMENWVNEKLREQSKLMLYTFDGEKIWEHPMGGDAWAADLSQDGKYAAYATLNEHELHLFDKIALLDGQTGDLIWEKDVSLENFPSKSPTAPFLIIRELQISHNNAYIGIGMGNGDFYLLDRETGDILWSYFTEGDVRRIIFSGDDSFVYVGADGKLHKFNTSDGTLKWKTRIWSWPYTYGLDLSPDETLIAVAVKSGDILVIRTDDGSILWEYDMGIAGGRWVDFSPDGTMLAVGSGSPSATTIFRVSDGTPLWRTEVSGAGMYTHDGSHIVLADGIGKIYTWDGTLVAELDPGFDSDYGYWKVAHINHDESRIVFAARDMRPGGVGITFFEKTGEKTVELPDETEFDNSEKEETIKTEELEETKVKDGVKVKDIIFHTIVLICVVVIITFLWKGIKKFK